MILHYAHLCAAAGGVDAFLIGSELRGITQVRERRVELSGGRRARRPRRRRARDPRVGHEAQLRRRLVGVLRAPPAGRLGRRLLPPRPALGRRRRSTSSASTTTCRSSDWRDGLDHLDAASWPTRSPTSTTCAATSRAARASTGSTPAPPTARRRSGRRSPTAPHGKPWVFRYKDIRSWWSNPHRNRPGGVESGAPTAWVPESKPIRFTEIGCPAVDRGPNQPNVFYDPKSAESFLPYFSRGWRDDAVQRRFLEAVLGYWAEPANNPTSSVYSRPDDRHRRDRRLDLGRAAVPGLPGAQRRLDRRRQLAARPLAERPPRARSRSAASSASSAAAPGCRTARSTSRRSPTSSTAT